MSAFARLLRRLDLAQEDDTLFVGGSGGRGVTEANRLFGGLVLAQAAVAAARTVPDLPMHALHGFFLRPGRPDRDIRFAVDVTKAGRSFHTRSVTATQEGKPILQLLASFAANRADVAHQPTMPSAPAPEGLPNRDQLRGRNDSQSAVIDVRLCDALTERTPLPAHKRVWLRPTEAVPADPVVHMALLVYATDRAFLSTAWRPHADKGQLAGASLDHSLWLHDAVTFDDWLLFDMHSPAARHGRGLVQGTLYQPSGRLLGNVAQQGTLTYRPWSAEN
ncbi:MAG: acyl-CoA thioesterase [Pseudomonadales bacterium]